MVIAYLLFAWFSVSHIISAIKSIKSKNYFDTVIAVLSLPFLIFFISSIILGGSAFNDAAADYELYQAGHYYLVSHGDFTEVTYGQYQYMKIIEIVGIGTFLINFILAAIRHAQGKSGRPSRSFEEHNLHNKSHR